MSEGAEKQTILDMRAILELGEKYPGIQLHIEGDVTVNVTNFNMVSSQQSTTVVNQNAMIDVSIVDSLNVSSPDKERLKDELKKLENRFGTFKDASEGVKNITEICQKIGPQAMPLVAQLWQHVSNINWPSF